MDNPKKYYSMFLILIFVLVGFSFVISHEMRIYRTAIGQDTVEATVRNIFWNTRKSSIFYYKYTVELQVDSKTYMEQIRTLKLATLKQGDTVPVSIVGNTACIQPLIEDNLISLRILYIGSWVGTAFCATFLILLITKRKTREQSRRYKSREELAERLENMKKGERHE